MDFEEKPSVGVLSRTLFLGGFAVLALLSLIQIILSGVLLNHEHDVVAVDTAAITPAVPAVTNNDYTFDHFSQTWASGPEGERPPGFEGMSWQDVVNAARGSTVTFAGWKKYMGGTEDTHNYVPFLTKQLLDKYDITLNFIDANEGTAAAVDQAITTGGIDFIWLNKGNYLKLVNNVPRLTWGPYANLIPNGALFNFEDPVINSDWGLPTNGEEMPLHVAHYVFVYDPENMPSTTTPFPPKNIGDLVDQIQKGEVSFHPSTPSTFLGTPFLELVFYHYAGDEAYKFREEFDIEFWNKMKNKVFPILKDLHSKFYLDEAAQQPAKGTTGPYRYGTDSDVRRLFKEGKIHLSAEYSPGAVFNKVEDGDYPITATAFILEEKMPANTNFLTIVGNAPNKAGAMVAINLAASMEHQFKRFIPTEGSWKGFQAFSVSKRPVKNSGWLTVFDEIETFENAPSYEELEANSIGEFNKEYFNKMVSDFDNEIGSGEEVKQP